MDFEEAIARFERNLGRLRVDFERFFNGALPTPPDELRQQVFDDMKAMRSLRLSSFADRFRLNGLEARLNSLNELLNRRLREWEQEGTRRAEQSDQSTNGFDPYEGVVVGSSTDHAAVEALYGELYSQQGRVAKTDFASFESFLDRQAAKIRKSTGCSEVRFRVASEKGKLRLKAKPV